MGSPQPPLQPAGPGQVMTNLGPRPKRLDDALSKSTPTGILKAHSPVQPHSPVHPGLMTLPPLEGAPALPAMPDLLQLDPGPPLTVPPLGDLAVSPNKKQRASELHSYTVGTQQTGMFETLLHADVRNTEAELVRDEHRTAGRLLLEAWLDDVLDTRQRTDPKLATLKSEPGAQTGLMSHGIARAELAAAGLTAREIDRLYRGLYVYTVGFYDLLRELLIHKKFRRELLHNIWRSFLTASQEVLKVAFHSDYLSMIQSSVDQAAELMIAKEHLADVQEDNNDMEKTLAWLTGAHAEERSARQELGFEVDKLRRALEKEKRAHTHAVTKYVTEVEHRQKAVLDVARAETDIQRLEGEKAALEKTLARLRGDNADQAAQLADMRSQIRKIEAAFALDPADPTKPPVDAEGGIGDALSQRMDKVTKQLAELHEKWNEEKRQRIRTQQELFHRKDEVRGAHAHVKRMEIAVRDATDKVDGMRGERDNAMTERMNAVSTLHKTEQTLAKTEKDLRSIVRALDIKRDKKRKYKAQAETQAQVIKVLKEEVSDAKTLRAAAESNRDEEEIRVKRLQSNLGELGKGMGVILKALRTNECAKRCIRARLWETRREFNETRERVEVLKDQVDVKEIEVKNMSSTIEHMEETLRNLESDKMGSDKKLMGFIDTEKRRMEQLNELQKGVEKAQLNAVNLNKELQDKKGEISRLKQTRRDLKDEISDLTDRVDDRGKEIARLNGELANRDMQIQDQAEKLETNRKSMEEAEISWKEAKDSYEEAAERSAKKLKLANEDIDELTKRVMDARDALEKKRDKKRYWKTEVAKRDTQLATMEVRMGERMHLVDHLNHRIDTMERDIASMAESRYSIFEHMQSKKSLGSPGPSRGGEGPDVEESGVSEAVGADPEDSGEGAPELAVEPSAATSTGSKNMVDASRDQLETMADELDKEEAEVQEDILAARRSVAALEKKLADGVRADAARADLDLMEHEIEEGKAATDLLRKKLERVHAQQEACERAIEVLDSTEAVEDPATKMLAEHVAMVENLLLGELSSKLKAAEKSQREVLRALARQKDMSSGYVGEITSLGATISNRDDAIESLKEMIAEHEATIERLGQELGKARNNIGFLQGEAAALKTDRERLKTLFSQETTKNETLSKDLQAAENAVGTKMEKMKARYTHEIKALKAKLAEVQKALTAKLDDVKKVASDLETKYNGQNETLSHMVSMYQAKLDSGAEPHWLYHYTDKDFVWLISRVPGALEKPSTFNPENPVVPVPVFCFDTLLSLISQIYVEKICTEIANDERCATMDEEGVATAPQICTLETFVYDFFLFKFGMRTAAEAHLAALVQSVKNQRKQHKRIEMFGRLLGVFDPIPQNGVEFYLKTLSRIHARAGPLIGEATEGASNIPCYLLMRTLREMLKGRPGEVSQETLGISDRLRNMTNGNEEADLDMDTVLEMAMDTWLQQRASDEASVTAQFRHADAKGAGIITYDEFRGLLQNVDHTSAQRLGEGHMQVMFREAMRISGLTNAVSLQGFTHVVFNHAVVGLRSHRYRHEAIENKPPYDECALVEDSWKTYKDPLVSLIQTAAEAGEDLVSVSSSPDKKGSRDLSSRQKKKQQDQGYVVALIEEFTASLAARSAQDEVWRMYRRVMAFFVLNAAREVSFPSAESVGNLPNEGGPNRLPKSDDPSAMRSNPISPATGSALTVLRMKGSLKRQASSKQNSNILDTIEKNASRANRSNLSTPGGMPPGSPLSRGSGLMDGRSTSFAPIGDEGESFMGSFNDKKSIKYADVTVEDATVAVFSSEEESDVGEEEGSGGEVEVDENGQPVRRSRSLRSTKSKQGKGKPKAGKAGASQRKKLGYSTKAARQMSSRSTGTEGQAAELAEAVDDDDIFSDVDDDYDPAVFSASMVQR